jgi:hypothetical protein
LSGFCCFPDRDQLFVCKCYQRREFPLKPAV